jgi:hypothetical protein
MSDPIQNKQNQSRYSGLSEEIIAVLKDRDFQDIMKPFAKARRLKYLRDCALLAAAFAGLGVFYWQLFGEIKERKIRQITYLIDEKQQSLIDTTQAILGVRKTRDLIRLGCEHGQAQEGQDVYEQRISARLKLEGAAYKAGSIFGNEVSDALLAFATADEGIKNVCALDKITDDTWNANLVKAEQLMRKALIEEKAKLGPHERVAANSDS